MADATTTPKHYLHNNLQRIEASDINTLAKQAVSLDEEAAWALVSAFNGVIDGFHVTHKSGRDFYVHRGSALHQGRVLKDARFPDPLEVTLAANGDSNPRIDVVYIAGGKETPSDTQSKVMLSSYTRVSVTNKSLGVGDGETKLYSFEDSRIDIRTLKVKLGGSLVGGWSLSPQTGDGGVDQLVFVAPIQNGLSISADYVHESGGVEANASVPTRQKLEPDILVQTGTPDASPAVPGTPNPTTDIPIAHITVPGSWSGGSPSSVANDVKPFLLHPDQNVDPSVNISSVQFSSEGRAGRIAGLLRHVDQLVVGGRLRYGGSDTIEATALWGVLGGLSIHSKSDEVSLSLQAADAMLPGYVDSDGWWFVYLTQTTNVLPGQKPALFVSQSPPNNRRRESSTNSGIYVGAIYLTDTDPVTIQPFFSHGDWVYWENPSAINISSGTNDVDVTQWCPPTGRLLHARAAVNYAPDTVGGFIVASVISHKESTGKDWPQFQAAVAPPTTGNHVGYGTGSVRAEDDSGTRYIHTQRAADAGTVHAANVWIQGYMDDFRTMDDTALSNAAPTLY